MGFVNSDVTNEGQLKPDAPAAQLYNLKSDLGQHSNVLAQHPDIAAKMQQRVEQLKLIKAKSPKPKTGE